MHDPLDILSLLQDKLHPSIIEMVYMVHALSYIYQDRITEIVILLIIHDPAWRWKFVTISGVWNVSDLV